MQIGGISFMIILQPLRHRNDGEGNNFVRGGVAGRPFVMEVVFAIYFNFVVCLIFEIIVTHFNKLVKGFM